MYRIEVFYKGCSEYTDSRLEKIAIHRHGEEMATGFEDELRRIIYEFTELKDANDFQMNVNYINWVVKVGDIYKV